MTPWVGPWLLQSPPRGNVQKEIRFSHKAEGSLTLKLFNSSPDFLSFFTNLIPLLGWESQPQECGSFRAGGRSGPSTPDATFEGCLSLSARLQGPAGRGVACDHRLCLYDRLVGCKKTRAGRSSSQTSPYLALRTSCFYKGPKLKTRGQRPAAQRGI